MCAGEDVYKRQVESALMTHPAVGECAITCVPDEIRGQGVKATIVLAKEYKARTGEEDVYKRQTPYSTALTQKRIFHPIHWINTMLSAYLYR